MERRNLLLILLTLAIANGSLSDANAAKGGKIRQAIERLIPTESTRTGEPKSPDSQQLKESEPSPQENKPSTGENLDPINSSKTEIKQNGCEIREELKNLSTNTAQKASEKTEDKCNGEVHIRSIAENAGKSNSETQNRPDIPKSIGKIASDFIDAFLFGIGLSIIPAGAAAVGQLFARRARPTNRSFNASVGQTFFAVVVIGAIAFSLFGRMGQGLLIISTVAWLLGGLTVFGCFKSSDSTTNATA